MAVLSLRVSSLGNTLCQGHPHPHHPPPPHHHHPHHHPYPHHHHHHRDAIKMMAVSSLRVFISATLSVASDTKCWVPARFIRIPELQTVLSVFARINARINALKRPHFT